MKWKLIGKGKREPHRHPYSLRQKADVRSKN